jgi:hypothetical protein
MTTSTVGSASTGLVEVDAADNATVVTFTVRADEGREAHVALGHTSLLEVAASCAAIVARQVTAEEELAVYSDTPTYGSTPVGRLSLLPLGTSVLVAVTPEQGDAGTAAAELTFEDIAQLGQHCAAAAHNR